MNLDSASCVKPDISHLQEAIKVVVVMMMVVVVMMMMVEVGMMMMVVVVIMKMVVKIGVLGVEDAGADDGVWCIGDGGGDESK